MQQLQEHGGNEPVPLQTTEKEGKRRLIQIKGRVLKKEKNSELY